MIGAMKQYPIFYPHPDTGEDCLIVVAARNRHERDLRAQAIASTWHVTGPLHGDDLMFVYWFQGRSWAGTVPACSYAEADRHLAQLAKMVV